MKFADLMRLHEKVAIRSRVCRMALIQRALESSDPGAWNGGSGFIFRHFGADLRTFEVVGLSRIWNLFWIIINFLGFQILSNPTTSKVLRSVPKFWGIKFDTLLDESWSKIYRALRINPVRQTGDRKTIFFWKSGPDWNFNFKSIGRDSRFWSIHRLQKFPYRS